MRGWLRPYEWDLTAIEDLEALCAAHDEMVKHESKAR
jgi:hypothetical protein